MPAGIADDQSKDFDFEKTEMKYDSTGMFHWSPARNLEDCILVSDRSCILVYEQIKYQKIETNFFIMVQIGSQSSRNDRS